MCADIQQGHSQLPKCVGRKPDSIQQQQVVTQSQHTHQVREEPETINVNIFTVSDRLRKADPILVTLLVNTTKLEMEVDTGAALSVISETRLTIISGQHLKHCQFKKSIKQLRTYTGKSLEINRQA